MNISFLVGNLIKDPQKVEGVQKTLCKISLAVNENYTKDGERPVQYFSVSVWGKLAENCLKYLKKGSKITVIGKLQNRSWEDEKGIKRYAQEIVANEIEFVSTPKEKEQVPEACEPVEEQLPF